MFADRENFLELIDGLRSATTQPALTRELRRVCAAYDFHTFCFGGVPLPGNPAEQQALLSGWPPEWFDIYMKSDRVHRDPVIASVLRTLDPIVWSSDINPEKHTPEDALMHEAADFGLKDGFTMSMLHPSGIQSVATFATDKKVELSRQDNMNLSVLCHYALRSIFRMAGRGDTTAPQKLTRRQREVLQGIAIGENATSISDRLALSERVVRWHAAEARKALNARTQAQAVAVAKDLRLI